MDNKAKSQVNSESIAVILTQLGAKRVVLTGLNYPELRLFEKVRLFLRISAEYSLIFSGGFVDDVLFLKHLTLFFIIVPVAVVIVHTSD